MHNSNRSLLKSRPKSLPVFRALTLLCLAAVLLFCGSCANTEIIYARATKLPEEDAGFMRIATEDPIDVDVIGVPNSHTSRPLAAYCVVHEQDLAGMLRTIARFQRVLTALFSTNDLAVIRAAAAESRPGT